MFCTILQTTIKTRLPSLLRVRPSHRFITTKTSPASSPTANSPSVTPPPRCHTRTSSANFSIRASTSLLQHQKKKIFPLNSTASRPFLTTSNTANMSSATSFYDFKTIDKKGNPLDLSQYKGKVLLIVNTASKCGFTPQFGSLETLYKDLHTTHPDFTILGFPCNQFGNQDPGNNDEIQSFCQVNYGVSFPITGKIDVNGDNADKAWEWMKAEKPGLMGMKRIKWNFEKFLIGRDGKVKGRWASTTKPETLKPEIEKALNEKA